MIYAQREKMWADANLDMREFERVVLLGAVDRRWKVEQKQLYNSQISLVSLSVKYYILKGAG